MTATDSIAELRAAVERRRAGAARRRGGRPRALPRPAAEARAGRLQLQRGDAAGGSAGGRAARGSGAALQPSWRRELGAGGTVERVEVAGPGFVNIFLSDAWYRRAMDASRGRAARTSARRRPRRRSGSWSSSSPPTRPARCTSAAVATPPTATRWCGCWRRSATRCSASSTSTTRAGRCERFAASLAARMKAASRPRTATKATTSTELAERHGGRGDRPRRPRRRSGGAGVELILEGVRETLGPLQRPLRQLVLGAGPVRAAARWTPRWPGSRSATTATAATGRCGCAATEFGDDKDRVLVRAGGEPTYLAADVAYHWGKLERGFERLIDVLGADHHGYAPRLRAAIAALGADPEALEALIMRLVHIVEGGRAGPDVEAQRRLRLARRAGRRHRGRRDALVHALAQPRHGGRSRPRAGPARVERQPRLLRPVRARPDRQHPAQGGRRTRRQAAGGGADRRARRWRRPRRRWSSACWSSPRRCARPPRGARRTGSAPTRPPSPPTSTPSTATARSSAPRARGSSAPDSRSAC